MGRPEGFTVQIYIVCCDDQNKSITYKRQDRNNLGLNRLVRDEPPTSPLLWCYACYCCMPSSPVLLHIYCPHSLSCCIYTILVSLLFGIIITTSFNILMQEMFLLLLEMCSVVYSFYYRSYGLI